MTTLATKLRPLQIGPITIDTPLVLAPMRGVTSHAFRLLCRHGAGLVVMGLLSSHAILTQRLEGKAESAGHRVELVPAEYTSKTCSRCGAVFENLTLSARWVECSCGLSLDRGVNAAINILCRSRLGHSLWASTQGTGLSVAQEAVGC